MVNLDIGVFGTERGDGEGGTEAGAVRTGIEH
jgi:hypothetical protein